MKTKRRITIALVVLLIAAAAVVILLDEDGPGLGGELPRFSQMVYQRPDIAAMESHVEAVKQGLAAHIGYRSLEERLDQIYVDYWDFCTMRDIAYIRYCADVSDAYYAQEYGFCEAQEGLVHQLMEEMFYACALSDKGQLLEEKYFWEGFTQDYADESEAVYDEELVAMARLESELLGQYRAIMANATVESPYGEMDYHSYLATLDEPDYANGMIKFYYKYNEDLSQIYIDLVKLRQSMAKKLGYDDYEQMQYEYYWERDYSPQQAADYTEQVRRHLVPLMEALGEQGSPAYEDLSYLETARLHAMLAEGAKAMGGAVGDTFSLLDEYELHDLELRLTKAERSFQVFLANYQAPYLFLDARGDMSDVLDAAHEFGHCVDAYVNGGSAAIVDVAEFYSQAMEYLLPGYLDKSASPEEVAALYRIKMEDSLSLFVQQASFADFEHQVYAMDPEELSSQVLNDLSFQLAVDYGYYDGVQQAYYAMSWTDISHFFEAPFYVIAYPVSNDLAMQIYERERQSPGAGLEKYQELLALSGGSFMALSSEGGLQSPFAPGRMEAIAADLRQWLLPEDSALGGAAA